MRVVLGHAFRLRSSEAEGTRDSQITPHPRRWKSGGCSVVSPAPQAQHCTLTRMRDSRRRRRSSGRPEGTKNRIMQKERQTWSDPSSPEIQHSQPNSGSAPVHFEEGSTLNHGKARANVDGPPRVENSNLHNQSTVSIIQPYP